jgi:(R)-1-hydroxy-2-aminoethylphosphonate ammonia-lyase
VRSTPYIPPQGYWDTIRSACDRHGTLLILDEVPHCLGRTGKMFTVEHYGIVPDMLVIGKGLGGGIFPLAALIAREALDVAPQGALGHFTHEKNPVACAAALATLAVIEDGGLLERARTLGEHALARLRALQRSHPLIGDVRGLGLLLGVELVRDRSTMARATDEAERVMYRAMELGLNFKLSMGNVITLMPPLTITGEELDQALAILAQCVSEVERAPAAG